MQMTMNNNCLHTSQISYKLSNPGDISIMNPSIEMSYSKRLVDYYSYQYFDQQESYDSRDRE